MDFFKFFQKDSESLKNKNEISNEQIRFIIQNQNSTGVLFDTFHIDNMKNAKSTGSKSVNSKTQTLHVNSTNGPSTTVNPKSTIGGGQSPLKQMVVNKNGRIEMLREMIFGTVPMNVQGTTTKIHYLHDSQQILLTKLFTLNFTKRLQKQIDLQNSNSSSVESSPNGSVNNYDKLVNMPSHQSSNNLMDLGKESQLNGSKHNLTHSENGNSSSSSIRARSSSSSSSPGTPNSSTNINGNKSPKGGTNNTSTLIPLSQIKVSKLTVAMCLILGPSTSNQPQQQQQQQQQKVTNVDPLTYHTPTLNEEVKQQLSKFQQFIITHYLLIDLRIKCIVKLLKNLLYSRFTQISNSRSGSLSSFTITEANLLYTEIEKFRQHIKELYQAPRLEKPIWLDILTSPSTKRQTISIFLKNLSELLPIYNTPKSNFFISNLITNILSSNLTWLSTMIGTEPNQICYLCTSEKCNQMNLYQNQFLYQLSQMYGYNGCLSCKNRQGNHKLSKCLIISPKEELNKKFLQIASYFWRSFELVVNRNFLNFKTQLYQQNDTIPVDNQSSTSSMSSSLSLVNLENDVNLLNSTSSYSDHQHLNNNNSNNHSLNIKLLNNHYNESMDQSNSAKNTDYIIGSQDLQGLPSYYFDLTRSLMGGYSLKYISDCYLLGLPNRQDPELIPRVIDDLRVWLDHHPFPQGTVRETQAIIADVSKCKCEVYVCSKDNIWNTSSPFVHNGHTYSDIKLTMNQHSEYISSILSSIVYFWTIGMPPESCMIYLEDQLRNLFNKTVVFNETLKYYASVNQPFPSSFNLFQNTTPSTNIQLPSTVVSPISTPKHSPNTSMKYQNEENGDMFILENIYTFLNNTTLGDNSFENSINNININNNNNNNNKNDK
ncbi:hypothetical protein DLAC_07652 [Tieghemostelium lacteum]|uniref:UDENN FNIP1/2-type domain-containing protein n=1 Tax=Tieghemostelium lacteum TaxID=361077 RepID=A0A151ZD17_TIELA|nr:hypothetical protein DLAC_07652 [Tieghemostelium lacteum]|eukprot:KYQ91848.1 hypothetical protein DLAC_07652 [Tieghemostelium lacteum]